MISNSFKFRASGFENFKSRGFLCLYFKPEARSYKLSARSHGFTLIETLVYLALLSMLMGGLIGSAYVLYENSTRNQTRAMLETETSFLVKKLSWVLSDAKNISSPGIHSHGPTLASESFSAVPHVLAQGGDDLTLDGEPLNNSNVSITDLTFVHTYQTDVNLESIGISFTAQENTEQGSLIAETASTTIYLRK